MGAKPEDVLVSVRRRPDGVAGSDPGIISANGNTAADAHFAGNRTRRGVNGRVAEWLRAVDGLAAVDARLLLPGQTRTAQRM